MVRTGRPKVLDDFTPEQFLELREQGFKNYAITKKLGVDPKTFQNWINENGFKGKFKGGASRLLDDLTVEGYEELKKEHKKERAIAEALHVSVGTLWTKKKELGITSDSPQEKKRINQEKVEFHNKLVSEGKTNDEIIEIMEFKSKQQFYDWKSARRKWGYDI